MDGCEWSTRNRKDGRETGEASGLGLVDHAKDLGHYPKSNRKLRRELKQRGDHEGCPLKL